MSAFFLLPKKFTVSSASATTTAPADNLGLDHPGLVWRSNGLTGVYVTVQLDGTAFDTIALVKSNLRATDTIQIRAGASSSAVAGTSGLTLNQTINAYSGTDPTDAAISVYQLATAITSPYVRIDITSTGNPAGYVQAQRLVIGQRVVADGVDVGDEYGLEDGSEITDERGFTTINPFGVRVSLKVSFTALKTVDYWTKWFPFLRGVGKSKAFLCVPDDASAHVQNQALFARMTSTAKGSFASSDFMNVEMTMLSVS